MANVKLIVTDSSSSIAIEENPFVVSLEENPFVVSLGTSGPQGPAGDTRSLSFVFTQTNPSAIWNISHGLTFVPSITVVDSAGSVVEGDYSYPDENTVIATFLGAFAGKAYLS